jgi:hypothetical protein
VNERLMRGFCASCKHKAHPGVDCPECGCCHYEDRTVLREGRQRLWLVTAAFFVRNRWIEREVRVKAGGQGGAALKGLRLAKREALKPRTRVEQVKLTLIPVRQSRKEAL